MTDRGSMRGFSLDRRGQMPFSMIALVLIIVSSLSTALIADLHDGSDDAITMREEIERLVVISAEAREKVQQMAWQSLLAVCSDQDMDEGTMNSRFQRELEGRLSTYDGPHPGITVRTNVSDVKLSFLRLPLDQELAGEEFTGKYVPAYIGLAGSFDVRVSSSYGNLSREYSMKDTSKVPWPLLNDRMKSFERSVTGGLGDLSSLVNYLLESLATYRTLQGWASAFAPQEGLAETVTSRDLGNAIDLGLILLQVKHFRQATPCYGMVTDVYDGEGCWNYVEERLRGGGTVDPADLFLGLYGYDEIDWRKVFSQTLNSAIERLSLRWMESLGLIKMIELVERAGEAVLFFANDLIDRTFDMDLAEEHFLRWLEEAFDRSGIPDTLYRYFGAGWPDGSALIDELDVQLVCADGAVVPSTVGGVVVLDIPQVDVLAWDGWGQFHEQYKKGTLEILGAIRREIAEISDQVSRSMFLPPSSMYLDPRDGISFIDELKASMVIALEKKDTWVRAAISAAEGTETTADPLAESAKAEFLKNRDVILQKQQALGSMVSSAAEQLLSSAIQNSGREDIPWEENLRLLEGRIITDPTWKVQDLIESTFEKQAQFLQGYFLAGLNQGSSSGTINSWVADVIARTGDPYAGISVILSDDVSQMLSEISHGIRIRGNQMDVELPTSSQFSLLGPDGRTYRESIRVEVIYPDEGATGTWISSSIIDPRHYNGSPGINAQVHDTDILDTKAASYQSVWKVTFSGGVSVTVTPGGEIGQVVPMKLQRELRFDSEMSVVVLTGHALTGVNYVNVNTLGQKLIEVVDLLLRPIQEGLGALTSNLRAVYRLFRESIGALVEMGRDALRTLSAMLMSMVEGIQDFLRSAISTLESKVAKLVLGILGERSVSLSFQGMDINVKLRPKDLAYREVGVPASISLAFRTDDCRIDVTTRLINGMGDLSILSNASLHGEDWTVSVVIDPFMDVFRHMVEVRGLVNGARVELVLPEVVSYREVAFSLSDIPGVGALLSNIPLPIPGLKGSVNAGAYLRLLEGRTDRVVINELELNPAGPDAGREWVELYNPTTEAVDLTGWTLETRHGVQGLGSLGGVLMPRSHLVYHFAGQALDNIGEGFPFEESLVLRDERGCRVDSAPFSTDCWNDGRTWQRAKDGADRWEFRSGTKGSPNGPDIFSILELDAVEQVFFAAVTESLYQLSSSELTLEGLAMTLETSVLRMLERLASSVLDKEIVAGLFVEVAVAEASSTAKSGMRMEVIWRCGTLRDALYNLASSARPLTMSLGNPVQAYLDGLPAVNGIWLGISSFGAIGVPKMIAVPGVEMEVRYQASVAVDLGVLALAFGLRSSDWSMEAGTMISGVPAAAVPLFKAPIGTTMDIWLCKVTVQGASD